MNTRPLLTLSLTVGAPQIAGAAPHGTRKLVPITGGAFEGPRLRGTVLPGGSDALLDRPDGVTELDVRLSLRTDDGALIYLAYRGIRHGPAEVIAALARGEVVDPASYYFRMVASFETGAPAYQFLHRMLAIGAGDRQPTGPIYVIEEVL